MINFCMWLVLTIVTISWKISFCFILFENEIECGLVSLCSTIVANICFSSCSHWVNSCSATAYSSCNRQFYSLLLYKIFLCCYFVLLFKPESIIPADYYSGFEAFMTAIFDQN